LEKFLKIMAKAQTSGYLEEIGRVVLARKYWWLGILAIGVLGWFMFGRGSAKEEVAGSKIEVQEARASQEVNKEFSFPLRNGKGEEVSRVKFTVDKAEIRDELIVKGKKATSVKGRTFLVLNVKVKNEYEKSIEVNTRDYIRLSVNGNEEDWLAPDIHNDPVEVQAISTKYTRVGFAINETDKKYVLRVGEIDGEKERYELTLGK